jgi:sugar/nucleoside kinase (ribokinase family)
MQEHDVVGIGNAIVDIIARCDDAFLARHGCSKGSMQLIDAAAMSKLYGDMGPAIEISGGSVANTIVGVASFGGRAGFIGKTANDQFGEVFGHDIRTAGVTFATPPAAKGSEPTACCLVLVTPDGQRTMNFLGSARAGSGGWCRAVPPRASSTWRAICSTGRGSAPSAKRPTLPPKPAGRWRSPCRILLRRSP